MAHLPHYLFDFEYTMYTVHTLPHYLFNFEYTMLKVHTLVYYLFNLEYKMHKVHTLLTRLSLAATPLPFARIFWPAKYCQVGYP